MIISDTLSRLKSSSKSCPPRNKADSLDLILLKDNPWLRKIDKLNIIIALQAYLIFCTFREVFTLFKYYIMFHDCFIFLILQIGFYPELKLIQMIISFSEVH